jgi:hypothetical protein
MRHRPAEGAEVLVVAAARRVARSPLDGDDRRIVRVVISRPDLVDLDGDLRGSLQARVERALDVATEPGKAPGAAPQRDRANT